jgi:hypothetical protein
MSPKLTPAIWDTMSEAAQAAYAERNDLLWRVIQAVMPGAGGNVSQEAEAAIVSANELRADNARLGAELGKVRCIVDAQGTDTPITDAVRAKLSTLAAENKALAAQVEKMRTLLAFWLDAYDEGDECEGDAGYYLDGNLDEIVEQTRALVDTAPKSEADKLAASRAAPGHTDLMISPEAIDAAVLRDPPPPEKTCGTCGGGQRVDGSIGYRDCPDCTKPAPSPLCSACGGDGGVNENECPQCQGTGYSLRKTDTAREACGTHRGREWQDQHRADTGCLGGCASDQEHSRYAASLKPVPAEQTPDDDEGKAGDVLPDNTPMRTLNLDDQDDCDEEPAEQTAPSDAWDTLITQVRSLKGTGDLSYGCAINDVLKYIDAIRPRQTQEPRVVTLEHPVLDVNGRAVTGPFAEQTQEHPHTALLRRVQNAILRHKGMCASGGGHDCDCGRDQLAADIRTALADAGKEGGK